MANFS
ncbi:hypothetical protein ECEC1849_0624, partial [Escherichia coli EC1849]